MPLPQHKTLKKEDMVGFLLTCLNSGIGGRVLVSLSDNVDNFDNFMKQVDTSLKDSVSPSVPPHLYDVKKFSANQLYVEVSKTDVVYCTSHAFYPRSSQVEVIKYVETLLAVIKRDIRQNSIITRNFKLHDILNEEESKNLQFKTIQEEKHTGTTYSEEQIKKIADHASKYVCSFANHQGGQIIFGIQDKNRQVVGITFMSNADYVHERLDARWSQFDPPINQENITYQHQDLGQGKEVFIISVQPISGIQCTRKLQYSVFDGNDQPVIRYHEDWLNVWRRMEKCPQDHVQKKPEERCELTVEAIEQELRKHGSFLFFTHLKRLLNRDYKVTKVNLRGLLKSKPSLFEKGEGTELEQWKYNPRPQAPSQASSQAGKTNNKKTEKTAKANLTIDHVTKELANQKDFIAISDLRYLLNTKYEVGGKANLNRLLYDNQGKFEFRKKDKMTEWKLRA
ncbi:hypothetical protein AKO1_002465 [Acrasis kona]|uniref:Schlafen AlbA-2 domain-containing protein n=1 Tax=Acrasis kona TaxID=1008807 RepID=A0AAW2ZN64_9EUKA